MSALPPKADIAKLDLSFSLAKLASESPDRVATDRLSDARAGRSHQRLRLSQRNGVLAAKVPGDGTVAY
jgi:hypothetical protein